MKFLMKREILVFLQVTNCIIQKFKRAFSKSDLNVFSQDS